MMQWENPTIRRPCCKYSLIEGRHYFSLKDRVVAAKMKKKKEIATAIGFFKG